MKLWKIFFIGMAYILALPFLIVWGIVKVAKYLHTLRRAVAASIPCGSCKNQLMLVGMWQCECGYTYQGHLMRPCPVCHRVPRVVRCYRCNVTTLLT